MVIKDIALGIVLFLANLYVCRGLFRLEYSRQMASIEGAYIGISRYAMAHWGDLSWFPLWYNGVPYQNTYPPLLHWVVALVAWTRGFTPAHAHHWVTALAYCCGPITVFALVRVLSGSRWAGFAAGLMYSALSPSAWLIAKVVADTGSVFRPRRLHALVMWGEGPHVSAMTLLPLAILATHLAVQRRRPIYVLAAAVSLAAVVLTNWIAAFALALGMAAYMVASMETLRWGGFLLLAAIGAAACGLAMPWAPPSTIAVTRFNAQFVGDFSTVYHALPRWLLVMAGGLAILKAAARRLGQGLQFAIFFTFLTGLIALSSAWFHVDIVPQGDRYHLEMEMAIVILIALAGCELSKRVPHVMVIGAVVVLTIALIQPLRIGRRYARWMISSIDITQTSEWKTAQWLNRNWSGGRVMLPGSTMFWLTAFSDTPELGGGYAQGRIDDVLLTGEYGLTWGEGGKWPDYGVLWLKALGVQAVGVSGPGSTEVYRTFRDPNKFEGVLDVLWRDGGDVLYRVGRSTSLAHVVPRVDLVSRTPVNGADVDPLRPYVAALDDPAMPAAKFVWTSAHSARVETEIREGQVISVQEAWHKGWHARVGGREVRVERDRLGMIVVDPEEAGHVDVDLVYDGGVEMRVAHWACGIAAVGLLAGLFGRRSVV